MAMPITVPRYTIQDLDSLPDDGCRYELLNGELLVTPAPLPAHQLVLSRLTSVLVSYLGPSEPAHVFSPGSVEVEPDVHLEPDILVVPTSALTGGLRQSTRWTAIRSWWLAVEVSGPGSRVYDRDHKTPAYLAIGVRQVWRADLRERCVFVSRPGERGEIQCDDRLVWHAPERAEPLVVEVPALFDGVR